MYDELIEIVKNIKEKSGISNEKLSSILKKWIMDVYTAYDEWRQKSMSYRLSHSLDSPDDSSGKLMESKKNEYETLKLWLENEFTGTILTTDSPTHQYAYETYENLLYGMSKEVVQDEGLSDIAFELRKLIYKMSKKELESFHNDFERIDELVREAG